MIKYFTQHQGLFFCLRALHDRNIIFAPLNMCNWASDIYKDRRNIHGCFLSSAVDPSKSTWPFFLENKTKQKKSQTKKTSSNARSFFRHRSHSDSDKKTNPLSVFDASLSQSIPVFLFIYSYTINVSLHVIKCRVCVYKHIQSYWLGPSVV